MARTLGKRKRVNILEHRGRGTNPLNTGDGSKRQGTVRTQGDGSFVLKTGDGSKPLKKSMEHRGRFYVLIETCSGGFPRPPLSL